MEKHPLKVELNKLLSENSRIFDSIYEQPFDGLWILNLNHLAEQWFSPSFCTLLGVSPEDVLAKNPIHPTDFNAVQQHVQHCQPHQKNQFTQTIRFTHSNNTTLVANCKCTVIFNTDGAPYRLIGVLNKRLNALDNYENLVKIIEFSPMAIWIANPAGLIVKTNVSLCEKLATSAEQIEGVYNVFDDKNFINKGVIPQIKQVFTALQPTQFELLWNGSKSGVKAITKNIALWLKVSMFPITNALGELEYVVCQWSDITELKETQHNLSKQRDVLETIINTVPHRIFWKDEHSVFMGCNRNFANDAGKDSSEAIIGNTDYDMVWKAHAPLYVADDQEIIATGKAKLHIEEPFTNTTGNAHIWKTTKVPLKNKKGKVKGVVGISEDITAYKQAEQDLKLSEERLRLSTESAGIAVWEYNVVENTMTRSLNHDALYGLAQQQVWQLDTFVQATHPDDREFSTAIVTNAIQPNGENNYHFDFRVLWPDQSIHWLSVFGEVAERDATGTATLVRGSIFDISEFKENEASLQQAQHFLKEAQRIGKIGSWNWNLKTNIANWTPTMFTLFGTKKQEITYNFFKSIIHPDDVAAWERLMAEKLENSKDVFDIDYRIIKPVNGEIAWIHNEAKVLRNSKGEALEMIGTSQDVTEQKLAYLKIAESEQTFRNLVENIQDLVYHIELLPTPHFTYVSPNSTKIIGYTPQELYDDPMLGMKIIHPDDQAMLETLLQDETNFKNLHILRWITKKGKTVWIEQRNTPIYDAQHRLIAIEGIARNISKRVEAEEALKHSEQKFRELYNQSPVAIQYYNAEGTLIDVNQKTLHLYGIKSMDAIAPYNFWNSNKLTPQHIHDLKEGKSIFFSEILDFEAIKQHGYFETEKTGILYVDLLVAPILHQAKAMAYLVHMLDVTDQKLAANQLRASEVKFRGIFEHANIGMAFGDPTGTVIDVNKEYLNITGYSFDEFVDLNYAEITHPDDLVIEAPLLQEIIDHKRESYRIEKRLKAKNGDYLWLDCAITCFRNQANEVESVIALVIDVTEKRRATESMKVFFDQPMNIHFIGTIDGEILMINEGWVQTLGYAKAESQGKNITDYIHPDDLQKTIDELSDLKDGKRTFYFENRYKHKSGHYITLAWSAIYNTSAKLLHGVAKDITQQKLYHEQLVKSEENYKALSENAKHLIITHQLNGEIQYANPFTLDFLGVSKEEIIGYDIKRFLTQREQDQFVKNMEAFLSGNKVSKQFELCLKVAHGDLKYLDVIGSPIIKNGQFDSVLITAYDITERKDAEQKIIAANEEYEALNEELRQTNDELFETMKRERESNDRYDKAIEATSDGLWDLDLITNNVYFSPRWKAILGYDTDELTDHLSVWKRLIASEDYKTSKELLDQLIEGTITTFDTEFKMKHKRGHWVHINSRARVFYDENGIANRIVGTHTDITDRKKAENKIRESEEMLRLAIDNSPLGISINDMDGTFISANKAYEKIVGYTQEELKSMRFFDITHPDYLHENTTFLNDKKDPKTSGIVLNKKYVHKKGHVIDVRIHAGSILNNNGENKYGMTFTEDISERKALENRNTMLYKAIESSMVSVTITNTQGAIEYVNPFFLTTTGYTK